MSHATAGAAVTVEVDRRGGGALTIADRLRRPILPTVLWTGAYAAIYALLLSLLYWQPRTDLPREVDAVVVLGVPQERLATGLELIESGYADTLVVSIPDPDAQPLRVPAICQTKQDAEKIMCFTPDPFSTEGEASYVAALAAERGWDEVLVVTFRSHVNRARWYFERCAPEVETLFIANDSERSLARYVNRMIYETGAWLKVATLRPC